MWGQEIFPFKASLELPNWENPETKRFHVGKKRRKPPCTAQAIGGNKGKILEKLITKLQPLPWDITDYNEKQI